MGTRTINRTMTIRQHRDTQLEEMDIMRLFRHQEMVLGPGMVVGMGRGRMEGVYRTDIDHAWVEHGVVALNSSALRSIVY